jgi:hypothetical protein
MTWERSHRNNQETPMKLSLAVTGSIGKVSWESLELPFLIGGHEWRRITLRAGGTRGRAGRTGIR